MIDQLGNMAPIWYMIGAVYFMLLMIYLVMRRSLQPDHQDNKLDQEDRCEQENSG